MKKQLLFLSILLCGFFLPNTLFGQGNSCGNATPFCTAPGQTFVYNNVSDGSVAPANNPGGSPDYGCLFAEPDPSWFYIKTTAAGTLTYTLSQGTTSGATDIDVDFVCWGPYNSAASFATACSNLTGSCAGDHSCSGNIVDCSFSAAGTEVCTIPATAAGQYYIILITNYSGVSGTDTYGNPCAAGGCPGYVNITADPANNPTDCSIECPSNITMLMSDSTNYQTNANNYGNNVGNVSNGATLSCNKAYYLYPQQHTSFVNPIIDIFTPCIAINFNLLTANLQANGSYSISTGGSVVASDPTGTIGSGFATGSNYFEYWSPFDTTRAYTFNFCKTGSVTSGGVIPKVTVQNCWDSTVLAGPVTWSGGGASCFTLSIPANSNIGSAYYTISPGSGASGLTDFHNSHGKINTGLLTPGTTYTVTYHFNGAAHCPQATGTFVFTTAAGPTVNITPTSTTICTGSSAILTASGTANTYTWSTTATTSTISVSPTNTTTPTVYTVVGTKTSTGCTNVATATVSVNPLPTVGITAVPSPSVCLGSSVSFTATGSATTFTWTSSGNGGLAGTSGANVSATPTSAANATYTVNATDGNGCKNSASTTININPLPTLTLTASSTTLCSSASATLSVTGSANNTYAWSSSAGGGLSGASGSSVTATPTGASATYTVVATNTVTNCQSAVKTTTITVSATPTISLTQTTYTTCLNVPVTFTASGATAGNYSWTPTTGMTGSTSANPTVTPSTTTTTVYSVTGVSGGCTSTAKTVTLTVNPLPNISVVPSTTAICSGGGSSTLTATGASTYAWASGATLSATTGSVVVATPTNTATPTVYTVTGTDANSCVNTKTVSITVNPTPTVSVVGGGGNSQTVCGGGLANATVAAITFTSNPSNSVTWTNSNTGIGVAATGSTNIATYPAPTVTAQTIGVITANSTVAGCTSTNSSQLHYTITINPIPGETGGTITAAGCGLFNGTISGASGTGGSTYSYQWNNAGGFVASSSYTNQAGTYPLQIKDNVTGCIYSQNFTIPNLGAPPAPTVTLSATSACVGGTVVLSAPVSGTTTYSWTPIVGAPGTGNTFTVTIPSALPNPFTVDVTATSGGCSSSQTTSSITVNPLPNPAISASPSQICQGSITTLSVTPTGAYSYQWGNSSGTIPGATSSTLDVTTQSVYSVTVTNNSTNCSASTSANGTITVHALPTIDTTGVITTQSGCSASTGSISNVTITGAATINYTWTSGSALPTGTLVGTGSGASASLSNVPAGIYCLNVVDGNTCRASFCSIKVVNSGAPAQPVLTAAGNDTTYCQGAAIQTLTATVANSGTVTPTINWYSDAGLTTPLATNTNTYIPSGAVGTTTIYVAATANGCTGTSRPIIITINPTPPAPTFTGTTTSSNQYCQGSPVPLTVNSGTAIAVWYSGNTVINVGSTYNPPVALPAGTYTYSVIDSIPAAQGGCTNASASANTFTLSLTVNPTPTVNVGTGVVDSAKCGLATGGVHGISNSSIVSGTPAFSYQWTNTATGAVVSTSPTLGGQLVGSYSLQITDSKGCIASVTGGSSTFTVPTSNAVHASATINPISGNVPLVVSFTNTSTFASSYTWNFGDTHTSTLASPTNTYTSMGTYNGTLVAVDASGSCRDTLKFTIVAITPTTIIIPNVFTPNGDGTNDVFFIPNTGMVSLNCDIYNRWGQLLHSITAPNQGWDGIVPNGDKAPEGTYMYILQAQGLDGKTYKQQGTVMLVR